MKTAQTDRKKSNGHRLKNNQNVLQAKIREKYRKKSQKIKLEKRKKNLYTEGLLKNLFIAG